MCPSQCPRWKRTQNNLGISGDNGHEPMGFLWFPELSQRKRSKVIFSQAICNPGLNYTSAAAGPELVVYFIFGLTISTDLGFQQFVKGDA